MIKISLLCGVLLLAAGCGSASDDDPPLDQKYVTVTRLHYLKGALSRYQREHGSMPEGDEADIAAILMNTTSTETDMPLLMLLEDDPYPQVDEEGHYLDAWGYPIQIEWTNDRSAANLRSVGRDGKNGSKDDLTVPFNK